MQDARCQACHEQHNGLCGSSNTCMAALCHICFHAFLPSPQCKWGDPSCHANRADPRHFKVCAFPLLARSVSQIATSKGQEQRTCTLVSAQLGMLVMSSHAWCCSRNWNSWCHMATCHWPLILFAQICENAPALMQPCLHLLPHHDKFGHSPQMTAPSGDGHLTDSFPWSLVVFC